MINSPLVSIVMPSLNQAGFIAAALDSVLDQDYPNIELIVADGGSSDGTLELLKKKGLQDSRLRWFSSKDNGPAQALNQALSQARGTLIGWLNSDDLYAPGAISRAVDAFSSHPEWLMIYGYGQHIDAAGALIGTYPTLPPSTPIEKFSEGCFICQPTVFFRHSQTVLLGKLDEQLKCAFDFDYWLRAFKAFPGRIGIVSEVQAFSRLHQDCITVKQRRSVIVEGMQVLARHLGHAPKAWVLTYVEELISGKIAVADGDNLKTLASSLLENTRPHLTAQDYEELVRLLKDDIRLLGKSGSNFVETTTAINSLDEWIQPQELIGRYSIPEHVRNADAYFNGRHDHWYLYQKPFFHPTDCAPSLGNLGNLFAGMKLQTGMTVLDFAAGSCWLSRILVQLGCKAISCDASQIALDIGKELFRRYPPITAQMEEPHFLNFNGETLALPDESVDRVIVNDSFHHIPNIGQVLHEMFRVLKSGGIVGMSEPGRLHSQTEDSQFEMRTFNVIENDFVLEDVWVSAQEAGFGKIEICPVVRNTFMTMEEYLDCLDGNIPAKVARTLVQDTTNHSIFFLHKLPFQQDDSPTNEAPALVPRAEFDEKLYLRRYPDVAKAVSQGKLTDGWQHYERFGYLEGRKGK